MWSSNFFILERLRSRFFSISREPRTSRSHVTSALAWGLQFEVHVRTSRPLSYGKFEVHACTSRPLSCGKWFTARFFHPKTSQSHVWEEILLLKTTSLISYGILFHGNLILKTISKLKQMNERTNENKHGTWLFNPRILSPKYGQTAKVKPLTANRSLPFVVRLPNLDLNLSIDVAVLSENTYLKHFVSGGTTGPAKVSLVHCRCRRGLPVLVS